MVTSLSGKEFAKGARNLLLLPESVNEAASGIWHAPSQKYPANLAADGIEVPCSRRRGCCSGSVRTTAGSNVRTAHNGDSRPLMHPRIPSHIAAIETPPFDRLNTKAAALRAQGRDVISLGQAVPFFPPPPSAIEAARTVCGTPEVHAYSTDGGRDSLRALLAQRLREYPGISCGSDEIIITAGANHAFTLAVTTLVSPGDEVVLAAPYFTNHYMAVESLGAIPIEAPLRDRDTFILQWSDIEPYLTSRTRAVVVCNPGNPTGRGLDAAEGRAVIERLGERGILVISDETYMHFAWDVPHWSAASVTTWQDNVIVIGTFSKCFGMMGWRVGFMLAATRVCEQALKVQDAMIICAPVISQIAVEAALRSDWMYTQRFDGEFRLRRQALVDGLAAIPQIRWMPAASGFFAFARVDGCRDSAALSQDLLERAHVVTVPGAAFGRSGEGYLRLSYGAAPLNEISRAVSRIGAIAAGDTCKA